MEIVVHQGEQADGAPLVDDAEENVLDVKNPAQATNKLVSTLNEYGRRLRELEKPSGSQLTQAIQRVLDISENIDQTVTSSINRNSYDRATIDQKCNAWNWGVLPPGRGGTNTTNAFNNLFSTGSWRAVWALSDGTLGTAQSSRKVKQDFIMPEITLEQMRAVDWTLYRYIDDVNLNGDSATVHLGMIAEELDDNGLGQFVEYNDDYEPCGINYPMLGVWAIHEAHLAHDRIDRLEERLKALEGKIDNGVEK
nr:MAG TPA: Endo-N-acetylneuraminidase [Caudoviricetes sp.]